MKTLGVQIGSVDRSRDRLQQSPAFLAILRDYRALLVTLSAQLRQAIEGGDIRTVLQYVHRVKGTAANYGYPDLSACATVCEQMLIEAAAAGHPEQALSAREFSWLLDRIEGAAEVNS